MPAIIAHKAFGLRLSSDTPRRDFAPGTHEISEAERAHWFMRACLAGGLAELVPAPETEAGAEAGIGADAGTASGAPAPTAQTKAVKKAGSC